MFLQVRWNPALADNTISSCLRRLLMETSPEFPVVELGQCRSIEEIF
jgi:hypothetical protein